MSGDDEHAENPPRGLANFVYWLVRRNDEHVKILRDMEHAVVFVQDRTRMMEQIVHALDSGLATIAGVQDFVQTADE